MQVRIENYSPKVNPGLNAVEGVHIYKESLLKGHNEC